MQNFISTKPRLFPDPLMHGQLCQLFFPKAMAGEDLGKELNGSGRTLLEQDLMMGSGGHPA